MSDDCYICGKPMRNRTALCHPDGAQAEPWRHWSCNPPKKVRDAVKGTAEPGVEGALFPRKPSRMVGR